VRNKEDGNEKQVAKAKSLFDHLGTLSKALLAVSAILGILYLSAEHISAVFGFRKPVSISLSSDSTTVDYSSSAQALYLEILRNENWLQMMCNIILLEPVPLETDVGLTAIDVCPSSEWSQDVHFSERYLDVVRNQTFEELLALVIFDLRRIQSRLDLKAQQLSNENFYKSVLTMCAQTRDLLEDTVTKLEGLIVSSNEVLSIRGSILKALFPLLNEFKSLYSEIRHKPDALTLRFEANAIYSSKNVEVKKLVLRTLDPVEKYILIDLRNAIRLSGSDEVENYVRYASVTTNELVGISDSQENQDCTSVDYICKNLDTENADGSSNEGILVLSTSDKMDPLQVTVELPISMKILDTYRQEIFLDIGLRYEYFPLGNILPERSGFAWLSDPVKIVICLDETSMQLIQCDS